jgi:hypothetical protein
MRPLKTNPHPNPEQYKSRMKLAKTASEFRHWQVLYLEATYRVTAAYLSDTTGYSKAAVYRILQEPEKRTLSKTKGGRKRELMSVAEEKDMMKRFENLAIQGKVVNSKNIKKAVEAIAGRSVSEDYIWDLFKRNGWKKHLPAPNQYNNTQTDPRKKPKTIWLPLRIILENIQERTDLVK